MRHPADGTIEIARPTLERMTPEARAAALARLKAAVDKATAPRTLVGCDLAELEPWAETKRRRRRARLLYPRPVNPSPWIFLVVLLGILALEYAAAHAWAWWWAR